MRNKILKLLNIWVIIFFLISQLSTVCADDVDEEVNEEEITEINNQISNSSTNEVANTTQTEPILNARRCIVYDRISKTVIYGKNEDVKTAMASTTKIMACTIVLENANLTDTVTVSAKAGRYRRVEIRAKEAEMK